jgi:hypothetical protein
VAKNQIFDLKIKIFLWPLPLIIVPSFLKYTFYMLHQPTSVVTSTSNKRGVYKVKGNLYHDAFEI